MTRAEIIIRTVADHYRTTMTAIVGKARFAEIVWPRHVAMWIIQRQTEMSLPEIGRVMHRDHTSVINGIRRVQQLAEDEFTKNELDLVEAECLYKLKVVKQRIRAAAGELRA